MLPGLLIFAVTYVLIAGRRLRLLPLERPTGALLGAVLMVACGVLTPTAALAAIDGRTLLLLFGLMGMGAFLVLDGFLDRAARHLAARARTRQRLLAYLVWGAGGLSALITNDAVCILGAPLVIAWVRTLGLPATPYLLALATAANTGSVATLVGNPQNMLCGSLGDLAYGTYLLHLLPVALLGLALNHLLIAWFFRQALSGAVTAQPPPPLLDRRSVITLAVLAGTVTAYLAGADLAWTSLGGLVLLMLVHRQAEGEIWRRIDWSVLLFFAGLFVAVAGLVASGVVAWAVARVPLTDGSGGGWWRASALFLIGSNLVSNVPFILVVRDEMARFSNPVLAWELLAMASTFAGNLTLVGSVANIIVAERSREIGGLGFWSHLRLGLPLALLTTALGTGWLLIIHQP